jgi:hypothetical protein
LQLYTITEHPTSNHKIWIPKETDDGRFVLRNAHSNKYLAITEDANGKLLVQKDTGTPLAITPTNIVGTPLTATVTAIAAISEATEIESMEMAEPELPPIPLTRGDVLLIMYYLFSTGSANGLSDFYDIDESEYGVYYRAAVAWAFENGITSGVGNNMFGKHDLLTKEQFVTLMFRVFEYLGMDTTSNVPAQISERVAQSGVRPWAQEAMEWAIYRGFFTEDEIYNFLNPVTNQDSALIVETFIVEMNTEAEIVPNESVEDESAQDESSHEASEEAEVTNELE